MPRTEAVEIVIQAANFVHNEGAYPPILFIGSQKNIERKQQTDSFMSFMIIGMLLMAAVHHLALFMLNRRRKTDFVFGICCFLFASMTNRLVPFLFPDYDWFLAFRLEYIVHYATFAAMAWLFHTLMPKTLHTWAVRAFVGVCAAFALSVLVFDTVTFSSLMRYFHYISIAFALYIMACFAVSLRIRSIKNVLAFAGAFIMGLFAINDIALHMPLVYLPYYPGRILWGMKFTSPVGMAFFVCCYSLLLAIDYAETQRREEMLTERNAFLDNLNRTKTEFLQNISHEMKTPLAVISTDILNADDQLDFDMDKEDMRKSLRNAQQEIMHMSRIVDNVLKYLAMLGTFRNAMVSSLIGFTGLISSYINLRMVMDTMKRINTEKKLAELDWMNNLKAELMATISHETRTPLAVLASYSGLIAMELRAKGVDEQTATDLDTVAFESKRVANLIDGMKRLTLRDADAASMVRLDLSELIKQTTRLYQHIFDRKNVDLTLKLDDGLPPVLGNPEELTQVLLNLLQNAKNHTEQGTVAITAEKRGETVAVTVSDTGAGIPSEILDRVFERGISGDRNGTGLGLAICREVIKSHGGTIEIKSEQNKGTAVVFTLPTYKGDDGNDNE